MKRYNVYVEAIYLILALALILTGITFFILAIFNEWYYLYIVLFILFMTLSCFPIYAGLPCSLNYLGCKKSNEKVKAIVVDKYQKSSKFNLNKNKYIIVIEYKVDSLTIRSANVVSKEIHDKIELKSKVNALLYKDKALMIEE